MSEHVSLQDASAGRRIFCCTYDQLFVSWFLSLSTCLPAIHGEKKEKRKDWSDRNGTFVSLQEPFFL